MLLLNNQPIDYFIFSGGEFQVKLLNKIDTERATLTWKPTDAGEIALLLLTVSALKHMGFYDIDLDVLYLPYARQDRVCSIGEAHSLEVICDVISNLDVSVVRLWDVHNKEKTLELLDSHLVVHINPWEIFGRFQILADFDLSNLILCAPDDGAYERVADVANQHTQTTPVVMAKVRDPETGKIQGMKWGKHNRTVEGWNVLIIDDICDGGATFLQAAQILKEQGAVNLYLYVTHGIFSKGLDLLQEYFKHIYCHHVLHDYKFQSTDRLTILKEFPHVP
jgi:ribose-phosphate pyrophosphokinase